MWLLEAVRNSRHWRLEQRCSWAVRQTAGRNTRQPLNTSSFTWLVAAELWRAAWSQVFVGKTVCVLLCLWWCWLVEAKQPWFRLTDPLLVQYPPVMLLCWTPLTLSACSLSLHSSFRLALVSFDWIRDSATVNSGIAELVNHTADVVEWF